MHRISGVNQCTKDDLDNLDAPCMLWGWAVHGDGLTNDGLGPESEAAYSLHSDRVQVSLSFCSTIPLTVHAMRKGRVWYNIFIRV